MVGIPIRICCTVVVIARRVVVNKACVDSCQGRLFALVTGNIARSLSIALRGLRPSAVSVGVRVAPVTTNLIATNCVIASEDLVLAISWSAASHPLGRNVVINPRVSRRCGFHWGGADANTNVSRIDSSSELRLFRVLVLCVQPCPGIRIRKICAVEDLITVT